MLIQYFEHWYFLTKYDDILAMTSDSILKSRLRSILSDKDVNLDAAYREITVILEDRLRKKSGLTEAFIGRGLIGKALTPGASILVYADPLSHCHSLCCIVHDLLRNPSHHKLIDGITKQELLRAVMYTDDALSKIDKLVIK
ncbi:MAG: hypothetical protein PHT88_00670 [Candidatus Moranbacteria bacterium]|nr:hypothetical protein [Candidatus Moranbacteria bacterium]